MSRCFPFPPPGYEKKPRPEEDILKEEKRREKNHKKDKKDKEKREGKDKKERDKSNGKHKDKDKKEKHRDKKEKNRDKKKEKEKEKYKDKDKSSISEDASVAGEPESRNGEKIQTGEGRPKDKSEGSDEKKFASQFPGQNGQNPIDNGLLPAVVIEESKFVQELGRRIRDEDKAMASKPVEKSSGADFRGNQETYKFPVSYPQNFAKDKVKNGERKIDNGRVKGQELRDKAQCSGNTMVQNLAGSTERKLEGMPGPVRRDTERRMVQNLAGSTDRELEGMPGPVQRDTERRIEEKDKSKEKGDDKRVEKRKDKDKRDKDKKDTDKKGKKSHGKDKGREKDKKKEEEAKEGTEGKKNDHDRSKELYRNEFTGSNNNNSSHLPTDNNNHVTTTGENLKKRKVVETNGFMHENEVRPYKVSRLTSHQSSENGRILEACRSPSLLGSEKQVVASQDRTDNKARQENGIIEAPSLYVSKQKPPVAAARSDQVMEALRKPRQADQVMEAAARCDQVMEASKKARQADQVVEASKRLPLAHQVTEASKKHRQADQIAEPSKKPPHPDLKYLSQILSVPKMEEWSEVYDQEWLSSSKGPPSKKPEVGSIGGDIEPRVWSEALHIESADIYALPYVIPY